MERESDWWVDFGLDQPSLDKVNLDQDRAPHTRSHRTRSGGWRVNRLGYGRCQGPAASGEGAGWPACQALAAWIR
jgi:hypothetical protein